jgi:hypothetical protein
MAQSVRQQAMGWRVRVWFCLLYSVQIGSEAHPMGTAFSWGVNQPREVQLTTQFDPVPRSKMVQLYFHFPPVTKWPYSHSPVQAAHFKQHDEFQYKCHIKQGHNVLIINMKSVRQFLLQLSPYRSQDKHVKTLCIMHMPHKQCERTLKGTRWKIPIYQRVVHIL